MHQLFWILPVVVVIVLQVNPDYVKEFESQNLQFVGQDEVGQRMEMLELKGSSEFMFVCVRECVCVCVCSVCVRYLMAVTSIDLKFDLFALP